MLKQNLCKICPKLSEYLQSIQLRLHNPPVTQWSPDPLVPSCAAPADTPQYSFHCPWRLGQDILVDLVPQETTCQATVSTYMACNPLPFAIWPIHVIVLDNEDFQSFASWPPTKQSNSTVQWHCDVSRFGIFLGSKCNGVEKPGKRLTQKNQGTAIAESWIFLSDDYLVGQAKSHGNFLKRRVRMKGAAALHGTNVKGNPEMPHSCDEIQYSHCAKTQKTA